MWLLLAILSIIVLESGVMSKNLAWGRLISNCLKNLNISSPKYQVPSDPR